MKIASVIVVLILSGLAVIYRAQATAERAIDSSPLRDDL